MSLSTSKSSSTYLEHAIVANVVYMGERVDVLAFTSLCRCNILHTINAFQIIYPPLPLTYFPADIAGLHIQHIKCRH